MEAMLWQDQRGRWSAPDPDPDPWDSLDLLQSEIG